MKKDLLKKVVVIGLALTLALGMTACGNSGNTESEDAQTQTQTEQAAGEMTQELAESVAIQDAGLTAGDVQIQESGFEEGKYEIEFLDTKNNIEYSYEIGEDGKIIEKSIEYLAADRSGEAIDQNSAEANAIKDAGFEADQIMDIVSGSEDGNYEVSFVDKATGDLYDYEIAPNGAILEKSVEFGKVDTSKDSSSASKEFNKDAAVAKALKAAKADKSEVAALEAEAEDGKYEVEFVKNSNGAEYSFEYDKNGKLIERSVDFNRAPATGSAKYSKDDAVSAVADFLDVSRDKVKAGTVMEDNDDGEVLYEVNFNTDNWRYEVEVSGVTGKVLEWSKERI